MWKKTLLLTPAYENEAPEVFGIGPKRHEDEAVQVETFDQDPIIVCSQEIDEEQHRHLTADLIIDQITLVKHILSWLCVAYLFAFVLTCS